MSAGATAIAARVKTIIHCANPPMCKSCLRAERIILSDLDALVAQRDALLAALKACIANHCGNANLFCSTCSPARTLIASIDEKGRP